MCWASVQVTQCLLFKALIISHQLLLPHKAKLFAISTKAVVLGPHVPTATGYFLELSDSENYLLVYRQLC